MRHTTGCFSFTEGQKMVMKWVIMHNASLMKAFCCTYAKYLGMFFCHRAVTVAVKKKKNSQASKIDQNRSIHAIHTVVCSSPLVDKEFFMYMDALLC